VAVVFAALVAATVVTAGRADGVSQEALELERSLVRGRDCTVQIGTAAPARRNPCHVTDGVLGRRLSVPRSCRIVPDPILGRYGYKRERCVDAPVVSIVIDLGRYQPLGPVQRSWPLRDESGGALMETSADGKSWQRWEPLGSGTDANRYVSTPVWARWVRLVARPGGTGRKVDQPAQTLEIDPQTGLVGSPPRKPRHSPNPVAEVKSWNGTLRDLDELVVLPPKDRGPPSRLDFLGTRSGLIGTVGGIAGISLVLMWAAQRRRRRDVVASWWAPPPDQLRDPFRPDALPAERRGLAEAVDRLSLGVAVASLIAPLLTLITVPTLIVPWIGIGLFLVFGLIFGRVGLVVAGVAGLVILVAALMGGRRWRRAAGLTALGATLSLALVSLAASVDDREKPVDDDLARSAPRPVPAAASPFEVVDAALRLGASDDREQQVKACGLLVRDARSRCRPGEVPERGTHLHLVFQQGDRAVVQYDSAGDAKVVRLVRSRRGWEMLELPRDFGPGTCITDAVHSGRDPFRCRPRP
jgi:hypothetical protein